MPSFDVTAPAAGDDVGDGDDQIRALKLDLNTFEGFARIYWAVDAAPPAPPPAYDRGRLWYVSDLNRLRVHDGTNWIDLSGWRTILPLGINCGRTDPIGVPWEELHTEPATGGWSAGEWRALNGVLYTAADYPTVPVTTRLVVVAANAALADIFELRLYDNTTGAAVAGSVATTLPGDNNRAEYKSAAFGPLVDATRYIAQVRCTLGAAGSMYIGDCYLEIIG